MCWRYQDSCVQKTIQEKSTTFTKTLNYVSFHAQFSIPECPNTSIIHIAYKDNPQILIWRDLYQNIAVFQWQMLLTRRVDTLWFWGIEIVWQRNLQTKISHILKMCLNYTNFSWLIFHAKLSWNPKLFTTWRI